MNSKLKTQNPNRHSLSDGVTHNLIEVASSPSPGGEGRGEGELSNSKFKTQNSKLSQALAAFTLVELLVVIAAIGILAAMLMPVMNHVAIHAVIQRAQSERAQLETAIQNYYSDRGFYPPGNPLASAQNLRPALTNQLYYELEGTTTNGRSVVSAIRGVSFTTLDNASTVTVSPTVQSAFHVTGFMNYTKGNAEDSRPAKNYLPGLPAARLATNSIPPGYLSEDSFIVLVTAANSDPNYKPLPGIVTLTGRNANPWRYLCPGVHNPNSYDLWIQIFVGGKTNLICNWKSDPEVNPTLP
jgi:prepilin-type N-terminal cleavage/methylation domain-containing protein